MSDTIFTNDVSKEVFNMTYQVGDESIDDRLHNVAKHIASIEQNPDEWELKFYDVLKQFKFIPGGRILSNAGCNFTGTTMLNCYVSGFSGTDQDSMAGIMDALRKQALILKSEGGYGFNASVIRPKGTFVQGIGNTTPGAVRMLEMWDKQSEIITAGGGVDVKGKKKIRKGAMLAALDIWHPDIEEFIIAKQTAGRLTKFNLSIAISDAFMHAVKNSLAWNLEFPDIAISKENYKEHWNGNLSAWKDMGFPTKIYKTFANANELWDLIMTSTYNRNEPGVLFVDTINRLNNLYYCEFINATNPCMVGDTLVLTNIGWIKFKNLEKYRRDDIKIITQDKDGKLFNSEFQWVGITEEQAILYRVDLSNGEYLLVNKKHKFYNKQFEQVSIETLLDEKQGIMAWGNTMVSIIDITALDRKEDVYDLTAAPNYNFFCILNRDEQICEDVVEINDNVRFKVYDVVHTDKGQKFAINLEENDELETQINKIKKPNFTPASFINKSILSVDCGEQALPNPGACLLGNINLTQYIDPINNTWDYRKLEHDIPVIVRFMDNVNDISNVPLDEQKYALLNTRRLGMGIMGYASALLILNVKYGSTEAIALTDKLMSFIHNAAYKASAELANEKGTFPLYDADKFLSGTHVKVLESDTIEYIKKYGLRNSHLMSIQPTGNTSVLANNVSGGLEPVFNFEYVRTMMIPSPPAGMHIPDIDWENKKIDGNSNVTYWKWIKEGDEVLLHTTFNGDEYKIDKQRGLTKVVDVVDYGVQVLRDNGKWDSTNEFAITADKLTIDEHLNTMKIMSKYVCGAISKTINLPNDYSYDAFKTVYMNAYDSHTIKGVTTYRIGTMANVLSTKKPIDLDIRKIRNGHIIRCQAPLRPKSVPCDIHHLTVGGQRWTVFVGLLVDETEALSPYEVFAFKKKNILLPAKIVQGTLTKRKRGRYDFSTPDELVLEDISSLFDSDEQQSVTRLISLCLRHGADIKFIVEQLNKASGNITDFSKAIARVLKGYIGDDERPSGDTTCPECKRENALIYSEGCVKCKYCGNSKC